MPVWLKQSCGRPTSIRQRLGGFEGPLVFSEHHHSHAASAFYPVAVRARRRAHDRRRRRVGDDELGRGDGNGLELRAEIHFPHSLGLLYSAFTYFCGFRVNSGEYKLMGLAPYGEPALREPPSAST